MTPAVVGLDIGGTKTGVVIESVAGERLLVTEFASTDWEAEPTADAATWIATRLAEVLPARCRIEAVGVGAQGIDNPDVACGLRERLAELFPVAVAVNDAALLVPAAGFTSGIGVIAGTGSIGVGHDRHGTFIHTGGWGSVIGDDAGAPGIVREAAKAALLASDDGRADDGLLAVLLDAFGVPNAERLARAVNDDPTPTNWGPRAPAVFAAADRGSALAADAIRRAASHLVTLVTQLVHRGAVGDVVVTAGSVITNQPRLANAFISQLGASHPALIPHVLDGPPAAGAVTLARQALNINN